MKPPSQQDRDAANWREGFTIGWLVGAASATLFCGIVLSVF